MKLEVSDKEAGLLKKQVSGLQEDNDRINRLYQIVEKEAFPGKKTTPMFQQE